MSNVPFAIDSIVDFLRQDHRERTSMPDLGMLSVSSPMGRAI